MGTRDVPLVAVAHGSADHRSAREVELLFARVRRLRPDLDVRVAYLDHVAPDPATVIEELATEGAGEVVVLPCLLTPAFHSNVDLPRVVERVHDAVPWLRVRYGRTLGPHPLLARAVTRRLAEAGAAESPDTALVLASAGSGDSAANAMVADTAHGLAELGAWRRAVAAYASAASPTPAEAVALLRAAGAERVCVASYLLAPGFFADRVAEQAYAAGADVVSAALGDCPELAALVLRRYDEARVAAPLTRA